jgi:16S rRNA (cytidine1402-2'-O)-methyltransferase
MRDDGPVPSSRLVLLGASLGNPGDASPRVGQVLAEADVVAAEDTRRARRLARDLGVTIGGRLVSCYDAVERQRSDQLARDLAAGATVALVTDAGMPTVSDPGYRLVQAALAAGAEVTTVPGPSAPTAALAVSGLPCDRWCFEGYLSRKSGKRRTRLAELAGDRRTTVFFESPHRVAATLADLADVFGADRPAAACRELTKTHEQVRRGTLAELADWAAGGVRGEITVVVAGDRDRQ